MAQTVHLLSPPTPSRPLSNLLDRPPSPSVLRLLPHFSSHLHLCRFHPCGASTTPSSPLDLGLGASDNGASNLAAAAVASATIDVDAVTEAELKENGFRSIRRTKLVCTIGPATCGAEQLEVLATGGMNVARVNMCHGTHEWHRQVIRQVRQHNKEKGFAVTVMMDTEGSEIHMGDLGGAASAKAEVKFPNTVKINLFVFGCYQFV